MSLQYTIIPVTPFQQNCSLIWCEQTKQAALVDPGGDPDRISQAIEKAGVELAQIWLTHGHLDHVGASSQLATKYGVDIIGPGEQDQFWLDGLGQQSQMFGFDPIESFTPTRYLKDGDTLSLGEHQFDVVHVPGHTPGHVAIFHPQSQTAWVGDVLFCGSIGRTDFPQSDHAALIRSIREKLWPLGEQVTFVPGHGPEGQFAEERRNNPFVADQLFS
ncbi:MBL fold metallo-hydrolase [Paraferrimonas sedimenticola]|uniref:MBL fold metallo-hydrolase n=1 Tax=Paraferrimonas sedimenticola TaxID=375674 RepID=A0AA37RW42_9GAMM|nr:MBL fold metallo-hydrolase [Paraferrimonas sedimenticola]